MPMLCCACSPQIWGWCVSTSHALSLSLFLLLSLWERLGQMNLMAGRGQTRIWEFVEKKDWVHTIFSPLWEHCPKNPVYNAFHRFLVVETKRFVGSSVNVILTRQICGQRSSRAAESKRRTLENSFLKQICYLFLIPKFRGDSDLGRCTFWALSKRKMLRHAEFGFFLRVKHVFVVRKSSRNMASKSRQIWEKRQDLRAVEKSFGCFQPNIAC